MKSCSNNEPETQHQVEFGSVPQERTFLDNYVINAMDRNKIVIIIVVRIISVIKISVVYI